jgi:hypothetical protein
VLLASAEIVTIEDRLAVRITDFNFGPPEVTGAESGAAAWRK